MAIHDQISNSFHADLGRAISVVRGPSDERRRVCRRVSIGKHCGVTREVNRLVAPFSIPFSPFPFRQYVGSAPRRVSRVSSRRRLLRARRAFLMRPLEHHELRDVARAVTDELDDDVDVAVEEASLGLGQERQRGAAPRLRGELSALDSDGHRLAGGIDTRRRTARALTARA